MLEITDIKLDIVENNKILAYATVTISDSIIITGIRLYEGRKGKFIVFPSKRSKKGRDFDIAFPCKDELRKEILQKIEMQYLNERIY